MDRRSVLLTAVAATALGLGIAGDLLLRPAPAGWNAALWLVALAAAAAALVKLQPDDLQRPRRGFLLLAALFALMLAWRNSPFLKALAFTMVVANIDMAAGNPARTALELYVRDYIRAIVLLGRDMVWRPLAALAEAARRRLAGGGFHLPFAGVFRGLVIAVPLSLFFGALFVNADSRYESLVNRLLEWDVELDRVFSHLGIALLCTWLAAGILLRLLARPLDEGAGIPERPGHAWATEANTVLTVLCLLFLSFVAVQFTYFFGGDRIIRTTEDLTYADYARRGFFELCAASGAVFVVLLLAEWATRASMRAGRRLFALLAGAQVVLVLCVMASALLRMALYIDAYGLTQLRLYSTGFMIMLAVILLVFCATVLAGWRERFAPGAYVVVMLSVAGLFALNPDALIVRVNVNRAVAHERELDHDYLRGLSADAVPMLTEYAKEYPDLELSVLLADSNWLRADWRTWDWGVVKARQVTERNDAAELPSAPQQN